MSLPSTKRPRIRPLGDPKGDRSLVVFGAEPLPTPAPSRMVRIRDGLVCWVDTLPSPRKSQPSIVRVFWAGHLAWLGARIDRDSVVPNTPWMSMITQSEGPKPGVRKTRANATHITSVLRTIRTRGSTRSAPSISWDNNLGMGALFQGKSWGEELAEVERALRAEGLDHPLNPSSWAEPLHSVWFRDLTAQGMVLVSSENPAQAAWAHLLAQEIHAGDLPTAWDPASGHSPLSWTLATWRAHRSMIRDQLESLGLPGVSSSIPTASGKKVMMPPPACEVGPLVSAAAVLAAADSGQPMNFLPYALGRTPASEIPPLLSVLSARERLRSGRRLPTQSQFRVLPMPPAAGSARGANAQSVPARCVPVPGGSGGAVRRSRTGPSGPASSARRSM